MDERVGVGHSGSSEIDPVDSLAGDGWSFGAKFEASLGAEDREKGVWFTPRVLAEALTRWAAGFLAPEGHPTCLDPACGGGAFLLSAAELLRERGVAPLDVVEHHLVGIDIDERALAVTRAALVAWARNAGARRDPVPVLVHGDALLSPLAESISVDLVVGNPPFQSQLASATALDVARRRSLHAQHGRAAAYTDTAWWFLLACSGWLREGGVGCLLQPQSILGSRDAGPVRRALVERDLLAGLWWDDSRWFDASVQVCAPVVRVAANKGVVRRATGIPVVDHGTVRRGNGDSFSPLVASLLGVPSVDIGPGATPHSPNRSTVGELARVTAGFRDEYYGLVGAIVDSERGPTAGSAEPGLPARGGTGAPLITVGHVDPAVVRWATRPVRIAKATRLAPRVDPAKLDARLARWVAARQRPKLLVASQGRVVEAAADPEGDMVPLTPLISVEPDDNTDIWRLLAVLLAPPVSAHLATERVGTGLGVGSIRLSASDVAGVPLPRPGDAWLAAAGLLAGVSRGAGVGDQERHDCLDEVGRLMCVAYELDATATRDVVEWWRSRQPRPRKP